MITYSRRFKKKKRNFLYSIVFLIFLALGVLALFLNLNFKLIKERKKVKEELSFLEKELQEKESERAGFLTKISDAEKEDYLKKVAYEDFNLKEQGEKVVAFPIEKKNDSVSDKTTSEKKETFL